MAAYLPLYFDTQFLTDAADPAATYYLYSYSAGTTTPKATYTDSTGNVANSNPMTLNSAARQNLWLGTGGYSFELKTTAGALVKRWDNVTTGQDVITQFVSDLADTTEAANGAGMVGYGGPALNYAAGTLGWKLAQVINVADFVVSGQYIDKTGGANAAPFFQAAIDFAESLITTNNAYNDVSVTINVPTGKYNFGGTTVTWTNNGITVAGPAGRGATIIGDGTAPLFSIGDQTNTFRTRKASLINIQCVTLNVTNTVAAVATYRTATANILECTFVNWYIGLDCTRNATTQIRGCWFDNPNRTSAGLAAIRMQGTDETGNTPAETYTPGGGFHIVDCEFSGSSTTVHTTYGLMVRSCDGLYMNNCHAVGYETTLGLVPEATASSRVIIDINISNCYFDEPSQFSGAAHCIALAGTVKESISAAVGTYSSVFRGIRITNCLLRGDFQATSCLYIGVTDGDSWWDNPNTAFEDIIINGNTIRQSTQRGITVLGAATGAYVEPRNIVINNNVFDDNNSDGTTGSGSDIAVQAENVSIVGNTFGPAADSGADYTVVVLAYDGGATDTNNPGVVVANNNFSRASDTHPPAIQHLWITKNTNTANTLEADNLFPGTGKHIDEVYKLRTTDDTTTDIWSYQVPQGMCGFVDVSVDGTNLDGSKAIGYSWRVHFRNNAGTTTLSSGGANFTAVTSWNPDAFPTPPTAALAGDELRVQVTGPDPTTIMNWAARLRLTSAR